MFRKEEVPLVRDAALEPAREEGHRAPRVRDQYF